MTLWVECAQQTFQPGPGAGGVGDQGNAVRILTSEDRWCAVLVSAPSDLGREAAALADRALATPLDRRPGVLVDMLPAGAHMPLAALEAWPSASSDALAARLLEVDAPPLFMSRQGRLVLPPLAEEEHRGHLVRTCDLALHDADHLAMVSESYIRVRGGVRPWGWRDIAVSIRRLTDTRCDAEQLADALVRSWARIASQQPDEPADQRMHQPPVAISVLAMFVRPRRTATVWSGPPVDRAAETRLLHALLAEDDLRIVCGDTTAEIAARLMGARLILEPRPVDGWKEVPPVSRMIAPDGREPLSLVTEGVVTMRLARERLALAKRPRDLAVGEDGASRLARLLLTADKVRFLVGRAINPAQVTPEGAPLRLDVIERLAADLRARGKVVSVEQF